MPGRFRTGRTDIDVGNAAIGATRRKEGFGVAQVIGDDRGRKATLRNGLVQFEQRIEVTYFITWEMGAKVSCSTSLVCAAISTRVGRT